MDDRTREILLAVIKSYISTPCPVGSRYISKNYQFGLSSATIRNAMSDLEEMGYLSQPHTSSGRVPTDKGYELYIDEILYGAIVSDDRLLYLLDEDIDHNDDIDDNLGKVAKILSEYSQYLGIAQTSISEESIVSKMEMFSYKYNSDRNVVVTLATEDGALRHKIIKVENRLTQSDLNRISSYLNSEFSGYTLSAIRDRINEDISNKKNLYDDLISNATRLCEKVFFSLSDNIHMFGFSRILNLPDFSDIGLIKRLSNAIEDKQTIVKLIDKIMRTNGVTVYVGEKYLNNNSELSIVASRYLDKGRPGGVLGLIGPKRMNYNQAISIVSTTAQFISRYLNS
jgi:heat-inducible transcriptional repressor